MATNYPGSLDSGTQQPSPSASTEMDDSGFEHDVVHTNHSGAIIALETKLGTGDSNAVSNSVLAGTGSGTSGWTTGTLANAISGNAATATALETARTIGGVSFNGTGNINLPGVNTAGNQSTSGNAATATKLATARTIDITGDITASAVAFDGTSNIAISAAVNNDSHTHTGATLSAIPASDITAGNFGSGDFKVTGKMRATTSFLVSSTGDDGIGPVTGSYGSVQTVGTGAGNYEGYSINGHFVFMSNSTESCGIYNDVDNQWMLLMDSDSYTRLYDSDGVVAFGANDYTSGGTGSAGNGYVGVSTYCGGFSGTTAVMSTQTVAGASMKRLGFSSSSYEYKTAIADLAMSDEAFMSLKPITFHPNNQYVDSTGDVTEIAGGHTIVPDSTEAGETNGLMPLRRAGFGLEDLYGRDDTMILASEFSPDPNALVALLTQKLQETMTRVTALEAA